MRFRHVQAVSLIVTHPREGQILGPDDGQPVIATADTVRAPAMKLKLPAHLSAKAGARNQDMSRQLADDGEASGGPCGCCPGAAPRDDEDGVTRDVSNKAGPKRKKGKQPNSDANNAGASTAVVSRGEEQGIPASKSATAKSDTKIAKESKAKKTKTPSKKGKAKEDDGADKHATPEKAQDGIADPEHGADATPSTTATAKTKPSPKSKAKKPRVDPMLAAMEQAKVCRVEAEEGGDQPFSKTTLVVSPVVAAMQWRQEILRYMAPGEFPAACLIFAISTHGNCKHQCQSSIG